MMSAAHRFHAQLLSGTASWSRIPQHLPQLLDIVQSNAEFGESTTQELDFFKTAWRWACDNPTVAWEDTTQEVFATAFRKKLEDKDARSTKELLQAWTRGGVQDPSGENQQRIRDFFHLCDSAMARRLLETAPYVSQYLTDNQDTRDDWLDDALYRVKMQLPLMNQAVVYVYFNGGAQKLSSEQRRYANDMLLGLEAGVTVPFAFAKNLAAKHPFPEELQLAYLRLAAYHAFTTGAASEASRQGCMDHLGRWLQEQPPSTFATESLVMGALLSRATNGPWIADCAWESAAGPAWSHAKTTLPILEALHNIEWDERTWLNTLQALKPLFGELTAPSLNTLDLPTGWDFKV